MPDKKLEPIFLSIEDTALMTGESEWTVKDKLRLGTYEAKKSGRRTLIVYESVKRAAANLPDAKFASPRKRGKQAAQNAEVTA
jgi:hypothetical protein